MLHKFDTQQIHRIEENGENAYDLPKPKVYEKGAMQPKQSVRQD